MTARIVWVAETGSYDQREIQGIYDSPERAMAALPGNKWTRTVWTTYPEWPDLTRVRHWQSWENGLGWGEAATVTPFELTETGALRQVDVIQEQRLDPPDDPNGRWKYVPITADEADRLIAK